MSLTQEQIKKISENLSKIPTTDSKIEGKINSFLEYCSLLEELNTDNIIPTYSVISKRNILRKDNLEKKEISREQLLWCSNQQVVADQIAIANIMK